jgi:hypothetical protein
MTKTIVFIVLTYKREHELIRCIESIIASINSARSENRYIISIFDNDPASNISTQRFGELERISFRYEKRSENIGPRRNFSEALLSTYQNNNFQGVVCVSDDDVLLPNATIEFEKAFANGYDAFTCSSFIFDTSPSSKYHNLRIVPTRKYYSAEQAKRQFIIDSRVFTCSGYSYRCLNRLYEASPDIPKYLGTLWYPNAFISSAANNILFISVPIFVHAINNQTYWGDIAEHEEMFLHRIEMFENMKEYGFIEHDDSHRLIDDFIGHQSFARIVSVSGQSKFIIRKFNVLRVKLIKSILLERIPHYIVSISKRIQSFSSALRGL